MTNNNMKQVLKEVNSCMSEILADDGVFVADIKINTIEYYYDKNINKVKVKIKTTQNQNDKIFTNTKIQDAFDGFLQELANEMNSELTKDKELENLINRLIADRQKG